MGVVGSKRKKKSNNNNNNASTSSKQPAKSKPTECTSCMVDLQQEHVAMDCGHALCTRCAVTCIDRTVTVTDKSAQIVCPTCLATSRLEPNAVTRKVLALYSMAAQSSHAATDSAAERDASKRDGAADGQSAWEKELASKANLPGMQDSKDRPPIEGEFQVRFRRRRVRIRARRSACHIRCCCCWWFCFGRSCDGARTGIASTTTIVCCVLASECRSSMCRCTLQRATVFSFRFFFGQNCGWASFRK
jgi:hypothetical protein